MPYIIKCWIPVDTEDPKVHATLRDAQTEYNHCKSMQPENHHRVVEVEKEEYPDGHVEWIEV